MSDDGAHLGYGAEAAMKGVLGGEEPPRRMTAAEMRADILAAPDRPGSYDDYGRTTAKLILGFLERHPEASEMPADSEHKWPTLGDGTTDWNAKPRTVVVGLWEYMKTAEPEWYAAHAHVWDELTGFLWGWGVNAARRSLELPPVANPAIVVIGSSRP